MNTKKLALIIIFSALTVALNPAVSGIGIPAPYAPFLIYGLWEIPIVVAFLLISPLSGVAITLLNAAVLFAFFPGPLPTGPFYNLLAIFSMFAGIYAAGRLDNRNATQRVHAIKIVTAAVVLGLVVRVAVMTAVNYATLRFDYPIGFLMTEPAILGFLPLGALFNATIALYTIPIGGFIADVVKRRLKLNN